MLKISIPFKFQNLCVCTYKVHKAVILVIEKIEYYQHPRIPPPQRLIITLLIIGLPRWLSGKEPAC